MFNRKKQIEKKMQLYNVEIEACIIASKILDHINCSNCGNHKAVKTGICPYCGKIDEEVKKLSDNLINLLSIISNEKLDNHFIELLYFIKQHSDNIVPFKEIDEILIKNNAEKKINDMINIINYKIRNNQKLNPIENNFLSTHLKNNINILEKLDYRAIIKNIMLGGKVIDYESFEFLIIKFIKKLLSDLSIDKYYKKTEVRTAIMFTDKGVFHNGENIATILISFKDLKELYEKQNLDVFITIFHELEHLIQHAIIDLKNLTPEIINYIKDEILRDVLGDTYYHDNYNNISYEIDARIKSIENTINFLTYDLNLPVKKGYFDEELQREKELKEKEPIRIINGDYKTLDELFDEVIKDKPELLDKYPQLKIEYIVDNNIVRRKTKEELLETYEIYKNNTQISEYIETLIDNKEFLTK